MKDLRCMVGLHDYPKPSSKHPVKATDVTAGRLTLECPRCNNTKTIKWKGPPKPENDRVPFDTIPPPQGGGGW